MEIFQVKHKTDLQILLLLSLELCGQSIRQFITLNNSPSCGDNFSNFLTSGVLDVDCNLFFLLVSKDKYLFSGVFCLTGEDGAERGDFVFIAGRFSIGVNTPDTLKLT